MANDHDIARQTDRLDIFRSMSLSAPVGIGFVVNRVFLWINEKMSEITGYSRNKLEGQSACILYPEKDEFDRVCSERYEQIKARGTGSLDTQFKRKDGAIVTIQDKNTLARAIRKALEGGVGRKTGLVN